MVWLMFQALWKKIKLQGGLLNYSDLQKILNSLLKEKFGVENWW